MKLSPVYIDNIIKKALEEDIGSGDITTSSLIIHKSKIRAVIVFKEQAVLAGLDVAKRVFTLHDPNVVFKKKRHDGELIKKGGIVAELCGSPHSILACERTALNFLQHLSGIATTARKLVNAVHRMKVVVLDTRKTTPGLRRLEKYAARVGGCKNHRMGLYDMFLVKDNHLRLLDDFSFIKRLNKRGKKLEIEVSSLRQLRQLLKEKPSVLEKVDVIMLDNLSLESTRKAVKLVKDYCKSMKIKKRIKLEYSGRVIIKNIKAIAKTGIDYVSVGSALTLSAKAVDVSLEVID